MKKILLVSLLLVMALTAVACGGAPAVEQLAPTLQAVVEEVAPTIAAVATEVAPTIAAVATEVAPAPTEAPTEEPAPEKPAVISGESTNDDCAASYEGESIHVHQAAGLTGPLAQILGDGFINGSKAAVDRINADGGVCGVMLEIHLEDSQYAPEQELAIYDRFLAETPAPLFHLSYGSGAAIVLKDRVIEDKIPHITAGLDADAFYVPRNGYTFGTGPIYADQLAGFGGWLQDNWADVKPAGAGDDIVIGVIGWANAFGQGATTDEAIAYLEGRGITVLPLEQQEVSPTADVTGQMQNLLVNGANVIWSQALSFGPAQVIGTLRGMQAAGAAPADIIVGGVNWSMNTDVVNILGENAAIMNGYYGVFPNYWWNDTDNEGVQRVMEDFEASGLPDTKKDVGYLLSYGQMYAIANILRQTLNDVGFEGLTGEAFFNAMQEMGTIDAGHLMTLNAKGEDRAPREAQIRQAQLNADGKIEFVVIEDFFELPDTRPPAE